MKPYSVITMYRSRGATSSDIYVAVRKKYCGISCVGVSIVLKAVNIATARNVLFQSVRRVFSTDAR